MRLSLLLRSTLVAITVLAAATALPACSKKSDPQDAQVTAENISADDAITEQYEPATVTWAVQPDGKVKARIKAPDGSPMEDGVKGTLTVQPAQKDAQPVTAPLTFDAKAGVYVADIPKLDADLTQVSYELDVKGKPVKGAMHLPRGGTKELVANAKVIAEVKLPKDKKGPNGGIIQIAGDDLLEIVADQKSGETHVYLLDDDFKPIPVGKRKIKLGVVASAPEMVELAPEPKGLFFYGKLSVKANPSKLTVAVFQPEVPEPAVVLCGYTPGAVVVMTPGAVVLPLFVAVSWTPVIVVGAPPVVVVEPPPPVIVIGHGKGKGKHWKHGGHFDIHIH